VLVASLRDADAITSRPFARVCKNDDREQAEVSPRAEKASCAERVELGSQHQGTTGPLGIFAAELLARLWESHRYRVLPFPRGRGPGEVIEVYPRATLRPDGPVELQVAADYDAADAFVALARRYHAKESAA
jgi:hypothetical protein